MQYYWHVLETLAGRCTHTRCFLIICFPLTRCVGAWILTNGLRFGITKHLGQAVRDHSLASTSSKVRVVAIGIASWNMIHNRDALLSAKVLLRMQIKPVVNIHLHLLQPYSHAVLSFCILMITRWTSLLRTSHRTCHMDQCIPWTAIIPTLYLWKKIPTEQGQPVRWEWSCSNTSPCSALVMEVMPFFFTAGNQ